MAAPAYQTGTSATGTSSLAVTIPSGVTTGHWAFLGVMLGGATAIPSTPTGWTLVGSAGTSTDPKLAVYKRQIQAGDASSTVTVITSGGDTKPKHALLVVFDGDGSASVHDAISPAGLTSVSWTATAMAADQKTLRFALAYNNTATPTLTWNNSGSLPDTERQGTILSAGGTVMTSGVADSAASTGGTEAAETVSWVQNSSSAGVSLVLGAANAAVSGVVTALTLTALAGTASSGVPATVIGPAAALTTAALAGAAAGATGVTVAGATAAVTLAAPAGGVTGLLRIRSWTADDSQKVRVRVTLDATLNLDVAVTDPPTHYTAPQIYARRLSLVMPTPALDSKGRPT